MFDVIEIVFIGGCYDVEVFCFKKLIIIKIIIILKYIIYFCFEIIK